MYKNRLLAKLYVKFQKRKFVKKIAYFYFFIKGVPSDITLDKMDNKFQNIIKRILIRKIENLYDKEKVIKIKKYKNLNYIYELSKRIDNGELYYYKIKTLLENRAVNEISRKEKINVAFMTYSSCTWIGDELYNILKKSKKFEPYIFVMANYNGQNKRMIKEEYTRTYSFFEEKKMTTVDTYNINFREKNKYKNIPDICIWLTPWINVFDRSFRIDEFSLNTLHMYIPYGFMIADNVKNNFIYHQFNLKIHNLIWKDFKESLISLKLAQKYNFIKGKNAIYTGYPKMDVYFKEDEKISNVWEKLQKCIGNNFAKKIIYAPHHSLDPDDEVCFSTFAFNFREIIKIAQKYKHETVWVFKPHPLLKYKSILFGLFKDENEWDMYENEWNSLENAQVVTDGEYSRLFRSSDGLILDSVSFLAEYLYVNKPLLFLRRNEQRFNAFGQMLLNVHYTCDGKNICAIEQFVINMIINNQDDNYKVRKYFFDKYLNYKNALGKNAAQNIYLEIEKGLIKE